MRRGTSRGGAGEGGRLGSAVAPSPYSPLPGANIRACTTRRTSRPTLCTARQNHGTAVRTAGGASSRRAQASSKQSQSLTRNDGAVVSRERQQRREPAGTPSWSGALPHVRWRACHSLPTPQRPAVARGATFRVGADETARVETSGPASQRMASPSTCETQSQRTSLSRISTWFALRRCTDAVWRARSASSVACSSSSST